MHGKDSIKTENNKINKATLFLVYVKFPFFLFLENGPWRMFEGA